MFLKEIRSKKKKINFKLFDNESLKQAHRRVFFTISFFILIYITIFIRLTDVMIISNLFNQNNEIILDSKKIEKEIRGNIFDRNGILLASSIRSYSVIVIPRLITNKKDISEKVSNIFRIDQNKLFTRLHNKKNFYIKRNISPTEHYKINNIGEIGLRIEK